MYLSKPLICGAVDPTDLKLGALSSAKKNEGEKSA